MAVSTTHGIEFSETFTNSGLLFGDDAASLDNGGVAVSGYLTFPTFGVQILGADGDVDGGQNDIDGYRTAISELSNGNLVVAMSLNNRAHYAILNSAGGTVVAPTEIMPTLFTTDVDVAGGLAGGRFVMAVARAASEPDSLTIDIRNNDGSAFLRFNTGLQSAFAPSVAVLNDGAIALAWHRNVGEQQLWWAVFEANGQARKPPALLDDTGNASAGPSLVALENGGFAVAYFNNESGDDEIRFGRFAANGNALGLTTLTQNDITDRGAQLTVLSNGLLALGWHSYSNGTDVDPNWGLVDPVTGLLLASSTLGNTDLDDFPMAVAGMTLGRLATFTSVEEGSLIGRALQATRTSTGDDADDTIVGDDLPDTIYGLGGDDTLTGAENADGLFGGMGNDRFIYGLGDTSAGEVVDGGTGDDAIEARFSVSLLDTTVVSIEVLRFADFEAAMTIDIRADQIGGTGFANNLRVVASASGPDFLRVHMLGDTNAGLAGLTFQGWDSSEDGGDRVFILGDADSEAIFGSREADSISGGGGGDFVRGGLGNDSMAGGAGVDTLDYADRTAAVVVTLMGPGGQSSVYVGGASEDDIAEFENVNGGSAGDTLTGDDLDNRFRGGGGDDILNGGFGVDTLDFLDKTAAITLTLSSSGGAIAFIAGGEEDTVTGFERVYTGSGADVLGGDETDDQLYSDLGNDLVRGGLGRDLLVGGAGFDTLDYRDKAQAVTLTLNGGANASQRVGGLLEDTVREFEAIFGGSAGDTLTGDAAANLFRGGGGFDIMDGAGGVDTVDFRDKIVGVTLTLAGASTATGTISGAAQDSVRNIENILGGSGHDRLSGDGLANRLTGAAGNDELRGGGGADVFVYVSIDDSTVSVGGRDRILDFSRPQGDQIDVSAIDAIAATTANDAFVLGAIGAAGRLQITTVVVGSVYLVQGDVDGGGADFAIVVNAPTAPGAADFVL